MNTGGRVASQRGGSGSGDMWRRRACSCMREVARALCLITPPPVPTLARAHPQCEGTIAKEERIRKLAFVGHRRISIDLSSFELQVRTYARTHVRTCSAARSSCRMNAPPYPWWLVG